MITTATSDLDTQYRTCFENLDTQLELISSFPERVFEYLQSISTQVVKALEAFQDLTQALYATGARLPPGIQPLRGRASQAAEYLASEFSTGAAATNFLNSLTMYNAAQFRQSLNLSQELISALVTAQTLGHLLLQDACPHPALDLKVRLAPFAENMLSQVLATRGYFLHHQDFWDVFHPDLPFPEEADNPTGELVLYDHQAAQAASRYQPYPDH